MVTVCYCFDVNKLGSGVYKCGRVNNVDVQYNTTHYKTIHYKEEEEEQEGIWDGVELL